MGVGLPFHPKTSEAVLVSSEARFIAIGLDFGTTFSGVSWAFSERPELIYEVGEWPSPFPRLRSQLKVPSLIDPATGKWGYEVTPHMDPIRWFKLLLLREDDDAISPEIRASRPLVQARERVRRPGAPTATQLVGKYLKKLWDHSFAQINSRVDLDSLPIRVAITVPAIWPPYAQQAMREAARLAGITDERDIGPTTLELVHEPEMAGLSILQERGEFPDMTTGESFVVCDAGGGTVDVITYQIKSTSPLNISECVEGQGSLCGAFLIDEAFETHMRVKTKLKIPSLDPADYNDFIAGEWEIGAKRAFDNSGVPETFSLRPPTKAFHTMDRVRGRGNFSITRAEMINFFSRSLAGLRALVDDQCERARQETKKSPAKILLAGGLGDSMYIHDVLSSVYRGKVLRPLQPWSAVARGAVIRLLRDKIFGPEILARRSRFSYGKQSGHSVAALSDFDASLDTTWVDVEGVERANRMRWFLKKGEEVVEKDPVRNYYHESRLNAFKAGDKCNFDIMYSDAKTPPVRKDSSVRALCRISCDWDKPFDEWKPISGPRAAEGWRKHDDLVLEMSFEGEPRWKMKVGRNETDREVNVEYEG